MFTQGPAPAKFPLFTLGVTGPILAHQYYAFIKTSLSAIGLNPPHFSSHSFCGGGITFAFSHGTPTAFIKAQGDWKSNAYLIYLTLPYEHKYEILHSITNRLFPST